MVTMTTMKDDFDNHEYNEFCKVISSPHLWSRTGLVASLSWSTLSYKDLPY
jgi:hypothetical protein